MVHCVFILYIIHFRFQLKELVNNEVVAKSLAPRVEVVYRQWHVSLSVMWHIQAQKKRCETWAGSSDVSYDDSDDDMTLVNAASFQTAGVDYFESRSVHSNSTTLDLYFVWYLVVLLHISKLDTASFLTAGVDYFESRSVHSNSTTLDLYSVWYLVVLLHISVGWFFWQSNFLFISQVNAFLLRVLSHRGTPNIVLFLELFWNF